MLLVISSSNNLTRLWDVTITHAQDGGGNTTNETIENSSVQLSIARWYPQGRNYVFICSASEFSPTVYDFVFGDGNKNLNMQANNVYHTFAQAGTYTVTCTAYDSSRQAEGELIVNVV